MDEKIVKDSQCLVNDLANDCISRQAAIDKMAELQGRASTKAEFKGISKAWKLIKKLPSAHPERMWEKRNVTDDNYQERRKE